MAWALSWMVIAYLAGEYATGWTTSEGSPVRRVAVGFGVAAAVFTVPVVAGAVACTLTPPIITFYDLL